MEISSQITSNNPSNNNVQFMINANNNNNNNNNNSRSRSNSSTSCLISNTRDNAMIQNQNVACNMLNSVPIQISSSSNSINNYKITAESNLEELGSNNKQQNLLSSSSTSSASSSSSSSSFVSASIQPATNSTQTINTTNSTNSSTNNNNQCNNNVKSSNLNDSDKCLNQSYLSTLLLNNNNNNANSTNSPDTLKKSLLNTNNSNASYKKQKENYLTEKRRITNDILTIMRDERIIVLADWLKVRGSLKNWIKLYVILKPGIMLLFKSDKMKPGHWVGTIILNSCQLLERPSKKHGFCFKLFHPLERSIWASKGPSGETYINVPYMLLPTFYLIFRAPSEKVGNIWMEAIELALKSSNLIKPQSFISTNTTSPSSTSALNDSFKSNESTSKTNYESSQSLKSSSSKNEIKHQENDIESRHFKEISDRDETQLSDSDNGKNSSDEICSLNSSNNPDLEDNLDDEYYSNENSTSNNTNEDSSALLDEILTSKTNGTNQKGIIKKPSSKSSASEDQDVQLLKETHYVPSPKEEFGELGNKGQTEEVGEENRSLIFHLVKQVRPGMDLSKVVLPTFILEPRSFLEKLTDYYYHSDILAETINNDDPFERMKSVVKFYLSGFYKKPKGLKKPYNPILGEVFRSYWHNPKTDSKTFYIAEQVSHHPPITSFYVSNRKEGFCIYGTIVARSKFYGNSVSAIMDGTAKLILLNRGEEYVITLPYANCKGILIGKLTMELGGKVSIECAKTGYSAEIEFKLKPLLGGIEASNLIEGKIKFAKETVGVLNGKWDGEIVLQEKRGELKQSVFWKPDSQIIDSRLKRYIVPIDDQMEFESEKLWLKVSDAIKASDQHLATDEKTRIESKQREEELERRSKFIEYKSKLFSYDSLNKEWLYNYSDLRPWDPQTDLYQFESNFKILTKTKHNLKLETRISSDPRSSLLGIRNHQTPHIRHRIVESNDVIMNVPNAVNSYDVLEQYNDIKQRLEQIEHGLKSLSNNLDNSSQKEPEPLLVHVPNITKQTMDFKSNNFLICLFVAWLLGLFTAVYLRNLF